MKRMKYLKVLCFTTALSLSISLVPMTFVSAQSLDAVIASNEISHSDEQIEPHHVGEDNRGNLGSVSSSSEDTRGNLGSEAGSEVNVSVMVGEETGGQKDTTGSEVNVSSGQLSGTDGQMVVEAGVSGEETSGSLAGGQMDGNGGLSGQNQVPMSAEEFSSLLSSSSVTPDTTSRLSTTVTSLI